MKKNIIFLCLWVVIHIPSSLYAVTVIDATKDHSNGITRIPYKSDILFILSEKDSLRLLFTQIAEANLGLYYCNYGIGYRVADPTVSLSYKYEDSYNLYREYNRMNGDSATFAKKKFAGWCITRGSPDTIWNSSLHYPETVIACDTFQFYKQGVMSYYQARPIMEYYAYWPPHEPSITKYTAYPEYSLIQYLSVKCLDFTRHLKIQIVSIDIIDSLPNSYYNCLWLCWAIDGPLGDGTFLPGTTPISNNVSFSSQNRVITGKRSYRQITILKDPNFIPNRFSCFNLSGKLLPNQRLSIRNEKHLARGCYILLPD